MSIKSLLLQKLKLFIQVLQTFNIRLAFIVSWEKFTLDKRGKYIM